MDHTEMCCEVNEG